MAQAGDKVTRITIKASAPGFSAEAFRDDTEDSQLDSIFIELGKDCSRREIEERIGSGAKVYPVGRGESARRFTVFVPLTDSGFIDRIRLILDNIAPLFGLEEKIELQTSQETLVWSDEGISKLVLRPVPK